MRAYAVSNIAAFLADPDPAVRDVTLWALEEILPEELTMDLKWWGHFLAGYQKVMGESGTDSLRLGHLMSWYLECIDFRGDSRFEEFYLGLVSNMMNMEPGGPWCMFDAELISVLQPVLRPVYSEECSKMLLRIQQFLRSPDFLSDHTIMNCCRLLRCFIEAYSADTWSDPCFQANLELVTEGVVRANGGFNLSMKSFFELIQAVFCRFHFFHQSELGMVWQGLAVQNFKEEDFDILSSIASAFSGLTFQMTGEVRQHFVQVCIGLITKYRDILGSYPPLLKFMLELGIQFPAEER
jgi:hypothetical protein